MAPQQRTGSFHTERGADSPSLAAAGDAGLWLVYRQTRTGSAARSTSIGARLWQKGRLVDEPLRLYQTENALDSVCVLARARGEVWVLWLEDSKGVWRLRAGRVEDGAIRRAKTSITKAT